MKKSIALMLILLLMTTTQALSEKEDLQTMSIDDLIIMRDEINAEINNRTQSNSKEGYSGLIVSEKNIESGAYEFTCNGDVKISIWLSESSLGTGMEPATSTTHVDGERVLVYFDIETHVLVEGGTVDIRPSTEEWVPKTE